MTRRCFQCGTSNSVSDLYGYAVCSACQPTLGLLKDHTIRKHSASCEKARQAVPENPSYREEVDYRLKAGEERYIKQRIKLLPIQARLQELG